MNPHQYHHPWRLHLSALPWDLAGVRGRLSCPPPIWTFPPPSPANLGLSSKQPAGLGRLLQDPGAWESLGPEEGIPWDSGGHGMLTERLPTFCLLSVRPAWQGFCGDATANACLTPGLPLTSDSDPSLPPQPVGWRVARVKMRNNCAPQPALSAHPSQCWPGKPAEPVRHPDSTSSPTRARLPQPSSPAWGTGRGPQRGPCRPAWTLLLEGGERRSLLCAPLLELGGREGSEAPGRCLDFPPLKLEGTKWGGRGGQGEAQGGRKGGRRKGRNAEGAAGSPASSVTSPAFYRTQYAQK